ncbi:hypothetical protein MNO14_11970 [Luteimonas sp. S4-F44]|uniref:hypothetical protein n=1 Tax=Luteimonas sp. S4-F44 TaxID=2925842 RepID=UPI001F533C54|nr:hypothetical protein [Luteimonas sp. S4-F44]UNK41672.1 hypothetical protein MNO14_11970 [Luteimonas sp. S4-F44]
MPLRRACAFVLACGLPLAGAAQPHDTDPHPEKRVATAGSLAAPCLSIEIGPTRVSLPLTALDRAVAARPQPLQEAGDRAADLDAPRWRDESERLALIRGDRAAQLLASPRLPGHDRHGCTRVALDDVPGDARYLIGALLEHGDAAVWRAGEATLRDAVLVTRTNPRKGQGPSGVALYRLHEGERPFLTLVEWVA